MKAFLTKALDFAADRAHVLWLKVATNFYGPLIAMGLLLVFLLISLAAHGADSHFPVSPGWWKTPATINYAHGGSDYYDAIREGDLIRAGSSPSARARPAQLPGVKAQVDVHAESTFALGTDNPRMIMLCNGDEDSYGLHVCQPFQAVGPGMIVPIGNSGFCGKKPKNTGWACSRDREKTLNQMGARSS